jgi:hypothetical protein
VRGLQRLVGATATRTAGGSAECGKHVLWTSC